jgi:hypothetical protein
MASSVREATMIRRAGERLKVWQGGVAPVVQDDAPEVEPDEGYYTLRYWVETLVTAAKRDSDADFVDEVFGSILFHREGTPRLRAGRFRAYHVRLDDAAGLERPAFEILDGHNQALSKVCSALHDPKTGDLRDSIGDKFDVISRDLLVLGAIEILPAHRAKALGLAVASRLIDMLAGPASLVACCPAPLQFCPEYGDSARRNSRFLASMRMEDLPRNRPQSLRRLRAYWSRLGFTRVGRSMIYILSTSHPRPKLGGFCDTNLF